MKKLKKAWEELWDVTSIGVLVIGVFGFGSAFGSYKLYTILSYATSGWQTFWLWIKIVFLAIMAFGFIVGFIVLFLGKLDDIADAIKYDDKEDAKDEEDKNCISQ